MDSKVLARRSALINYRDHLVRERNNLVDQSEKMKAALARLKWSDTIREDIVAALNANFEEYNKIVSAMTVSIKQLNQLIYHLDEYFDSTSRL